MKCLISALQLIDYIDIKILVLHAWISEFVMSSVDHDFTLQFQQLLWSFRMMEDVSKKVDF